MYIVIIISLIADLCFQISFAQNYKSQTEKYVEKAMAPAQSSDNEINNTTLDTIREKRIVTEVIVNYRAEDKDWVYDNNSLIYKNQIVGFLLPSHEKQTITKRLISPDFDNAPP